MRSILLVLVDALEELNLFFKLNMELVVGIEFPASYVLQYESMFSKNASKMYER